MHVYCRKSRSLNCIMASYDSDFNIYKSLWSNINDVCAPPPPPGQLAKACFLMEMPGFSLDPDAFDPTKFDPGTMTSPGCATAMLCDRVPALAQYFYDTGDHISFYWQVLLNTYGISATASDNAALKQKYDDAIKMLYGGLEGYIKQEKTALFKNLDTLRENWQTAKQQITVFKNKCQKDKKNWPGNYETGVAPLKEAADQAYTEYNNLKKQLKHYEAAICDYAAGDLNTLMLDQQSSEILCKNVNFMFHTAHCMRYFVRVYDFDFAKNFPITPDQNLSFLGFPMNKVNIIETNWTPNR